MAIRRDNVPGEDNEHVEAVPCLGEVGLLADHAHRRHPDDHLDGEEGEDEMVEDVQDATARRGADLVRARLVQSERQTVEQNHAHTYPLEPRAQPTYLSRILDRPPRSN